MLPRCLARCVSPARHCACALLLVLVHLFEELEVLFDLRLRGPAVLAVQIALRDLDDLRRAALDLHDARGVAVGVDLGIRKEFLDERDGLVALLIAAVS